LALDDPAGFEVGHQLDDTSMVSPVPFTKCRIGNIGRNYGGLVLILLVLASCGPATAPQGISDPNETANRAVNSFNTGLDTVVVRPASQVYGTIVPAPVRTGVNNFAENLETPGDVVNNVLQGNVGNAGQNSLRFVVNLTFGIGGLFDAATAIGIPAAPTDFGETMHIWGAPEGNYVVIPLLGPSTERDLVGRVVDAVIDPVGAILDKPESSYATGANVASRIGDRYKFGNTFDSLLYESADGYVQLRQLYLENRRFELGQAVSDENFEDPYAE
jgi:phospholipid-binding lipoprotein MlaA